MRPREDILPCTRADIQCIHPAPRSTGGALERKQRSSHGTLLLISKLRALGSENWGDQRGERDQR
jgi:hypothetical protein